MIDIQLNKDGSLQSKHYTFDVGEVINSYNIDLFVNASSINQLTYMIKILVTLLACMAL